MADSLHIEQGEKENSYEPITWLDEPDFSLCKSYLKLDFPVEMISCEVPPRFHAVCRGNKCCNDKHHANEAGLNEKINSKKVLLPYL